MSASIRPNVRIVSATARRPRLRSSRNSVSSLSQASWSRSTITGIAPSRTKVLVIAAPMPFAPPVTITTLSFSRKSMHYSRTHSGKRKLLPTKVEEASVERKVHARHERGRVGTKVESKGCDLVWLGHSADRLRMGQLAEHFFLA